MTATAEPTVTTVWDALRGNPRRFLTSLWPVRALAYVVSGVAAGVLTLAWLPVALVLGAVIGTPALTPPLVALERQRLRLLGGPVLSDPHQPAPRPGLAAWLRSRYAEPVTWRELAYLVLHGSVLLVLDVLATALALAPILVFLFGSFTRSGSSQGNQLEIADVVVAAALAALAAVALMVAAGIIGYAVPLAAVAHGKLARVLLGPPDRATVGTLTRSRARLIDAFEVERRRIERDLHDGAQQRLLELGMTLVAAELELDDDPDAAKPLVRKAAEQARSALAEMRELVQGIHPRVLTDMGLTAAVVELADRSEPPVRVVMEVPHRLPSTVESAAYFAIAEALANAAKHANASEIIVTGKLNGARLLVEVRDNGVGGANPDHGSGIAGLADRVDAEGGTLTLSSPSGGPTILTLELPWT